MQNISEVYGDSPFDCTCLSLCFKKKGEELEFDDSKFTKLMEAREKDDWHESELQKEFQSHDNPSQREKLVPVKDFLVIETLQYDFSPLSFRIFHPS